MDYEKQVAAVSRSVYKDVITLTNDSPGRTVSLSQTFDISAEALWSAITLPERLAVWFAPVSGDLRLNGRYSVQGNASGTVTACEAPNGYALSWEFGESVSAVRVALTTSEDDMRTTLELTHTFPVNDHWQKYGAGAGGVGWDMTLLGLAMFVAGVPKPSEEEWMASREAAVFTERSSEKWRDAAIEGGEDETWAKEAGDRTTAFYIPGWEAKTVPIS